PTGEPIVPKRACLFVDASGIRQTVYDRTLDRAGMRAVPARSVEEALAKLKGCEVVVAETSLAGVADLPAAAGEVPVVALVEPGTVPPGGGFRCKYDRTAPPDGLASLLSELLFGPESDSQSTRRRRFRQIARVSVGSEAIWGMIHSVGPGGLFVRTLALAPVGGAGEIAFATPETGESVTIPVRVGWRSPFAITSARIGPAGLGLTFAGPIPDPFRRAYEKLPRASGASTGSIRTVTSPLKAPA
ncbi:MAG: hypothetical protein AABZ30_05950, partial [Myxococcota bacterium]